MILATHGIIASSGRVIVPPLLDIYPNAAAAYSLRRLRTAYTGSAIRVRRTNLDEMDIGFNSAGNLDTTALLAFTGTGAGDNGFVKTWYDQSGNGIDATQTTAANQPQIVSGGNVYIENLKSGINFSGTSNFLQFSSNFSTFNNLSIFAVTAPSTYAGAAAFTRFYDLYDGVFHLEYLRDGATSRLHLKNARTQSGFSATQFITQNAPLGQSLSSVFVLSANNNLYLDSVLQSKTNTSNVGTSTVSFGVIGQRADILSVTQFIGNYQELIIYESDKSSSLTGIELNINSFYSIF